MSSQTESVPVNSLLKAFALISHLSRGSCSLADLARSVAIPKSSAHRLLATLCELDIARKEEQTDNYCLTPRLFSYGASALNALDLVGVAETHMRHLRDELEETVHLAIRAELSIVYIHKVESKYSIRMYSYIGFQAPLYCTSLGKSFLAWMNQDEAKELIKKMSFTKFTGNTISSPEDMLEHLEVVRKLGYACDDEEHEHGVICYGVPVFDHYNRVRAAISVSTPLFRYDAAKKARYIEMLYKTGAGISATLGCENYLDIIQAKN